MAAETGKKKGGNIVAKATALAEPLAAELGFVLWDVLFEKEGATWYLKVLIDKDEGVDMKDCEAFSRPYNKLLDEHDFIDQSYVFECGSPGAERELRKPVHFERCEGLPVKVLLYRPDASGCKEYTGLLKERLENGDVRIQRETDEVLFEKKEVQRVNLVDDFDYENLDGFDWNDESTS